jgi:hypothetical protein
MHDGSGNSGGRVEETMDLNYSVEYEQCRTDLREFLATWGIGYTWDYGVHIWFKRAMQNDALLRAPRCIG